MLLLRAVSEAGTSVTVKGLDHSERPIEEHLNVERLCDVGKLFKMASNVLQTRAAFANVFLAGERASEGQGAHLYACPLLRCMMR